VLGEQLRDVRFHEKPVSWECNYGCGAALKHEEGLSASLLKTGTSPSCNLKLSFLQERIKVADIAVPTIEVVSRKGNFMHNFSESGPCEQQVIPGECFAAVQWRVV
jgi:hypothetical protein